MGLFDQKPSKSVTIGATKTYTVTVDCVDGNQYEITAVELPQINNGILFVKNPPDCSDDVFNWANVVRYDVREDE